MPGMTVAEYARHRGVRHVSVTAALRDGRITREDDGTIDAERADEQWAGNTDTARPRNSVTGTSGKGAGRRAGARAPAVPRKSLTGSYSDSRAKHERYKAELVKLEYRKRAGELLDAGEVREAAYRSARTARDLLRAIPDRLAAVVAGLDDAVACRKAIQAEVDRVCDELSGAEGRARRARKAR